MKISIIDLTDFPCNFPIINSLSLYSKFRTEKKMKKLFTVRRSKIYFIPTCLRIAVCYSLRFSFDAGIERHIERMQVLLKCCSVSLCRPKLQNNGNIGKT